MMFRTFAYLWRPCHQRRYNATVSDHVTSDMVFGATPADADIGVKLWARLLLVHVLDDPEHRLMPSITAKRTSVRGRGSVFENSSKSLNSNLLIAGRSSRNRSTLSRPAMTDSEITLRWASHLAATRA